MASKVKNIGRFKFITYRQVSEQFRTLNARNSPSYTPSFNRIVEVPKAVSWDILSGG
jgi:hypothetical protein